MKILISLLALLSLSLHAAVPASFNQNNLKYRTSFGSCPEKSSGELAIIMMKEFEKNLSLRDVKEKILSEKLEEKYFLSQYNVSYNPVSQVVKIKFNCPAPLVRVQVYRENGKEHYSAIMVDSGKLFDPSYEMLLKAEKLLKTDLPSLAISVRDLEGETHENFTKFATQIDESLRAKISEMIINENKELTIIFSLGGRTTNVFLGKELWQAKLEKLAKIISYVEKSEKYPTTINLTNAKKVVVRF
ncbi:MAG: hypothetical protein K2P81_02825 [Bacteriovoracaceae bacterium]|nr:hypothetical protein [Bacteriovoracaceae bacterium]